MKSKKNQVFYAIVVIILAILFAVYLFTISPLLSFFWFSGLFVGFILQKSRFCFVAALRDPYLIGGVDLTKAVLIALAITTIGFTIIKYWLVINNEPLIGLNYITPISLATVIGGFLFGIGMVLAGGCSSGTLMRVGEGFQLQLIVLIFFIIGSTLGAHDFGWWKNTLMSCNKTIFLPDFFGWLGALALQLSIIALLYIFISKWGDKNTGKY
ncbi:MAG: transporter [Firmicutes bacterium]|nr:transporter [Bacillota bacterium]